MFCQMLQNPPWYSHNSANISKSKCFVEMFCFFSTARPLKCFVEQNISTKHFDFGPTCIPQNVANEMFCRVVRIPRWVLQHFNKTFRRELFCRIVLSNCSFFEYHVGRNNSTKHFGEAAHVENVLSKLMFAELCEYYVQSMYTNLA